MYADHAALRLRYRIHKPKRGANHEEFVYLLRWKDRNTQASAWKKFLADPEWIRIKKTTPVQWGDLVDDVQDRSLDMLLYTPKPSLVP